MTAREMFEELGYEYKEYEGQISYTKWEKDCVDEYYPSSIDFDLKDKSISKVMCYIDFEEIKAINKQIEELGWLDEK